MTKVNKFVERVTNEISAGLLLPGSRLSSIRKAAEEFSVSRNTVIDAYERLSASGLIQAVQGSGFYVASRDAMPINRSQQPQHVAAAVDTISLLKGQLNQDLTIRVGDGRPPSSWMQGALPSTLKGNILKSFDGDQTGYGSAFGRLKLREMIAMRHRRIEQPISVEQIVTTFGANHALDLVIRRYLEPGDTVLVDDPGYYPLLAKLRLARVNIVGVPRTQHGPDVDVLNALAKDHAPKIFFTQSTCQNPTGTSMNLASAHGVLQTALKYGLLIVDNDPFIDLPGQTGTLLATLDQFNTVVVISTYSKLLSASFRVGYLIAPLVIAKEIAELKLVTAINSSRFSEIIISEMIMGLRYKRHLNRLAKRLVSARTEYHTQIKKLGLNTMAEGSGYYSFLLLPQGIDETVLTKEASLKGIFLAPGKIFRVNDNATVQPALRINVTQVNHARFYQFLKNHIVDRK